MPILGLHASSRADHAFKEAASDAGMINRGGEDFTWVEKGRRRIPTPTSAHFGNNSPSPPSSSVDKSSNSPRSLALDARRDFGIELSGPKNRRGRQEGIAEELFRGGERALLGCWGGGEGRGEPRWKGPRRGAGEGEGGLGRVGGPRSAGCMTLPRGPFLPWGPRGRQDALKITPQILSAMITEI